MAVKSKDEVKIPPTETWLKRTNTNSPVSDYSESHPSFGTIGINRVSGRSSLFQSDTVHQHYIALRIHEAERVVDGVRENVFARRRLVEVNLTEAQFAQMITQPNVGDGVPCTIHYNSGDSGEPWLHPSWGTRPDAPDPEPFLTPYDEELSERTQDVTACIAEAQQAVEMLLSGEFILTKGNLNVIKDKLNRAQMQATSNLPYIVKQMHEKMEERVSRAVVEFETYVSQSLQARGLEALVADTPRLAALAAQESKALPEPATSAQDFFDADMCSSCGDLLYQTEDGPVHERTGQQECLNLTEPATSAHETGDTDYTKTEQT